MLIDRLLQERCLFRREGLRGQLLAGEPLEIGHACREVLEELPVRNCDLRDAKRELASEEPETRVQLRVRLDETRRVATYGSRRIRLLQIEDRIVSQFRQRTVMCLILLHAQGLP